MPGAGVAEKPHAYDNRRPCDEAMRSTIMNKTGVFKETASAGNAEVPATDLREGQRVQVDYTGNIVAETCIGQTVARTVVILDPR